MVIIIIMLLIIVIRGYLVKGRSRMVRIKGMEVSHKEFKEKNWILIITITTVVTMRNA